MDPKEVQYISNLYLPVVGQLGDDYSKNYNIMGSNNKLSNEAQWLRFVAGAKAEAEASFGSEGIKVDAKIEGHAKFVLFEGSTKFEKFVPSKPGWTICYQKEELFRLRFIVGCELAGFVGANIAASAEIQVNVDLKTAKQTAIAIKSDPKKLVSDSYKKGKGLIRNIERTHDSDESDKSGNKAKAQFNAFAGATLEFTPSIELQWLRPIDMSNPVTKSYLDNLKVIENNNENLEIFEEVSSEEPAVELEEVILGFKTIAKSAYTFALSVGAGANVDYEIFIHQEKIKIRAAAHLCWGAGGKGAFDFEVSSEEIMELAKHLKCQLLVSGFKKLLSIKEEHYLSMVKVFTYMVGSSNSEFLQDTAEYMNKGLKLYYKWKSEVLKEIETSSMAKNIILDPSSLRYLTPDSKADLLYILLNQGGFAGKGAAHATDLPRVNVKIGGSEIINIKVDVLSCH